MSETWTEQRKRVARILDNCAAYASGVDQEALREALRRADAAAVSAVGAGSREGERNDIAAELIVATAQVLEQFNGGTLAALRLRDAVKAAADALGAAARVAAATGEAGFDTIGAMRQIVNGEAAPAHVHCWSGMDRWSVCGIRDCSTLAKRESEVTCPTCLKRTSGEATPAAAGDLRALLLRFSQAAVAEHLSWCAWQAATTNSLNETTKVSRKLSLKEFADAEKALLAALERQGS